MQRSLALPLFALSFVLLLGLGLWFDRAVLPALHEQNERLAGIERRLEGLERSMALLHFSAEVEGEPLDRVLEHLEYWASKRDESRPSIVDEEIFAEKLRRGQLALERLGPSSFPRLEIEFGLAENLEKQGYRMELLHAMRAVDPQAALPFYRRVVENAQLASRFRTEAARMMVEMDANFAAEVLQRVLLMNNTGGLRHPDPNMQGLVRRNFPGYDDILRYYMRTPHTARFDTLVSILNTRDYQIGTYNAVVRHLGELGDPRAIPLLKQRFDEGPLTAESMNPYFRSLCAKTVVSLAGSEACEWLKSRIRIERDQTIVGTLAALISKHCL